VGSQRSCALGAHARGTDGSASKGWSEREQDMCLALGVLHPLAGRLARQRRGRVRGWRDKRISRGPTTGPSQKGPRGPPRACASGSQGRGGGQKGLAEAEIDRWVAQGRRRRQTLQGWGAARGPPLLGVAVAASLVNDRTGSGREVRRGAARRGAVKSGSASGRAQVARLSTLLHRTKAARPRPSGRPGRGDRPRLRQRARCC
jgi:hypothetical protein